MNKAILHRLGDYIREVDVRNIDLHVNKLVGVNNAKEFIPSIANIVGTDLSHYKIITEGNFVYNPITTRNGDKISISLYQDKEDAIVSQAYIVFEIISPKIIPEYLFLWLKRSEFDRYARYKSHGSAREIFSYNEMADTKLPLPSVEEQHAIVDRHNVIRRKLSINKQIISRLEFAASTLYRSMFIDGIDRTNLPQGWKLATLDEIASISAGGDRPELVSDKYSSETPIPIYSNGIENEGLYGFTDKAKINDPCVTVSARGTIGFVCFRPKPFVPIVRLLVFSPINEIKRAPLFLTYLLKHTRLEGDGAVQLQLTAPEAAKTTIQLPPTTDIMEFEKKCRALQTYKTVLEQENKQFELFSLV